MYAQDFSLSSLSSLLIFDGLILGLSLLLFPYIWGLTQEILNRLLRHWWWKILGLGLTFYAIVMALATPLSSGIQVNLIEHNSDTLLSVKAHNADFVLGEKTLKLWAHGPDGYYSISDYSIEGADSLTIPLSNIIADSSGR